MDSEILGAARAAFTITPSDTVNNFAIVRALYVGASGNMSVFLQDGTSVLFVGVPQGAVIPVACLRINATGTTAASIVGLV